MRHLLDIGIGVAVGLGAVMAINQSGGATYIDTIQSVALLLLTVRLVIAEISRRAP